MVLTRCPCSFGRFVLDLASSGKLPSGAWLYLTVAWCPADEPYHDFWGGRAEPTQPAVEASHAAMPAHEAKQQEAASQVSAIPHGQDRDSSAAQHEQHSPGPLESAQKQNGMAAEVDSQGLEKHAEEEQGKLERDGRAQIGREQAHQAAQPQQEESGEAGQLGLPDLQSTDLLGSRALGPLGLALKDSGEVPAEAAAGPEPGAAQAPVQHSAPESMQRAGFDAGQKKKKRSGFGSLFKRKGSAVK